MDYFTKLLDKEIIYLNSVRNQQVKKIEDLKNHVSCMTFDRAFIKVKELLHETIPEREFRQFARNASEFKDAYNMEFTDDFVIIHFSTFTIRLSLKKDDDRIYVRFHSADMKCEYWAKEAIVQEGVHKPESYSELMGYQVSNSKYLSYCEQLTLIECFKKDPTFKKFCEINDIPYSISSYFTGDNYTSFLSMRDTCGSDSRYLLSLIKLEKERVEKYEYGISQIKVFYASAVPAAVDVLRNFSDLENRLTIENDPFSLILKDEIVLRTMTKQPKKKTIVFASNNNDKLAEYKAILEPYGWNVISQKEAGHDIDVEESASTYLGNAELKAEALFKATGKLCFADDSGIEVSALDGNPGINSRRWTDSDNLGDALLKVIDEQGTVEDRSARYITAICLFLENGEKVFFEESVDGVISESSAGTNGFAYDSVFFIESAGQTLAELPPQEKNKISPRGLAGIKMAALLNKLP